MLEWITDEKGRQTARDSRDGTLYRITPGETGAELTVFRANARRSCDRSTHPDTMDARQHAAARTVHERQLSALQRIRRQSRVRTPWGQSRTATSYGDGVTFYTTAQNDGFYLAPDLNAEIPESLRLADGWYLDDGDGARVALALPHLFTDLELEDAVRSAQELFPEAYELTGAGPSLR